MDHPPEQALEQYALDPSLFGNGAAVAEHLAICNDCSATVAAIRAFDDALRQPDAWSEPEDDDSRARFAELQRFADESAAEDEEARRLLASFEDGHAARLVWADLPRKPQYHTGGVVRRLNKLANPMCDRNPHYALALADTAIAIAEALRVDSYPAVAIHAWRGEAWKERANALYCLGEYRDALVALDQADGEFDQLPHAGVGHIAVLYVRALVLSEEEEYDAATRLAQESARAAAHLGEGDRFMAAVNLQAKIRFAKREIAAAHALFRRALEYGEDANNVVWIARSTLNCGTCEIELGRLAEARRSLERALRAFTALRYDAEIARTRWALARLLFAEQRTHDAIELLRSTIAEMTKLRMLSDAALAAVYLAEMLHASGRLREVARVLQGVVRTFVDAGKMTGALAALSYLNESAAAGRLTPAVAEHVRDFLRRSERQPQLLFAPPPPDEPV